MDISSKIGKVCLVELMLLGWVCRLGSLWDIEDDDCDVTDPNEMVTLRGCDVWEDTDRYLYAICRMHFESETFTETLGPRTDTIILSWGLKSNYPVNSTLQNICLTLSNITLEKNNSKDLVHSNEVEFFIAKALQKEYLELEEAYIRFVIFEPRIVAVASFSDKCKETGNVMGGYITSSCKVNIQAFPEPIFARSLLKKFGKIPPLPDCIAWFDKYIRRHVVTIYRIWLRSGYKRCKEALRFISHFNVTRLEFPNNSFRVINSCDFPLFKQLEVLNFSVGTIERIGKGAFNRLPKLRVIDLSRNRLKTIPQALYTTDLSELKIEENLIRSTRFFINGSSNLTKLWLSKNPLSELSYGCFSSFSRLTELYLNHCNLTVITDGSFQNLTNLLILDISFNRLVSILENVLKPLSSLRILNLSGNNIKAITSYQIHSLHNLEYLNLEQNNINGTISTIPEKLRHLNLRNNNIQKWNFIYSLENRHLVHLDLSLNKFTSITEDAMKFLKSIAKVNLSMNPYDCSRCSLYLLHSWQKQPNAVAPELHFCFTPVEVHNKPVSDFKSNSEECFDTPLNVVVVVAAAISSFFFLVLLAVCSHFRWHIYYFVYKYRRRIFVVTGTPSSKCYKYDAFVVYASPERRWVVTELLPKMEYSNLGFNFCVHDRDFVVGEWISENIINCMNNSRKIMLLLTTNFIRSQWCMFEAHLAQHRLFEKSKRCVILVKMGDLSDVCLSWYLQFLMNTRTYLEWPHLDEAKPLFWERLTHALRRQNSPVQ